MSTDLINMYYVHLEHHFDIMSIHLPHLFIKEGLKDLSRKNMNALLKDFKLWIGEKVKEMNPHDADHMFGVPYVPYCDYEIPRNASRWENEAGVRFMNFGCSIGEMLIKMIYQRFDKGDVDFFKRYHRVVCIRSCCSVWECCKVRKLVEEREFLECELAKLKNEQSLSPMDVQMQEAIEDFDNNDPDNDFEIHYYDDDDTINEEIDGAEPVEPELEGEANPGDADQEDEPIENSPKRFKA